MPRQQDNIPTRSFVRTVSAFIGRWTWRVVGSFLILGACFVLLAQTDFFRKWIRERVIEIANDALIGKLAFDDARLDLFRGIVLIHPRLYAEGTTVLEAEEISLSYDVASLFNKTIAIGELRVVRPTINLVRSENGIWNFERIVKPTADTTTSELPDLTIIARSLIIVDGVLVVNDKASPTKITSSFDPTRLHLSNIDLNVSARASLKQHDFYVAINGCSFHDEIGPVSVSDLVGVIRASSSGLDIQSLRILTHKSDVWLRARIDGVDILNGFSDSVFSSHPIVARVEADRVWGPELKYFIPDVDLLDAYTVAADARFDGNRLDIHNMQLTAGDASVFGSVVVDQLAGSKPLELDIKVRDVRARYADVRRRIRFVELPELPFLQNTQLKSVHLHGHPSDSLWFLVEGKDRPGSFKGSMTLFLAKPTLGYVVDMKIQNGDLSAFSDDPEHETKFNGRIMMIGSGLTLQDLYGTTQIELDRSRIFHRPLRSFRTIITADGKGSITIDTLFADVTPFSDDTTQVDPFSEVSSQRIGLHAQLNVSDIGHPRYAGDIDINGLDLASLFDSPSMPSRLSWTTSFDIDGVEIDSITGSVRGRVFELALVDRSMMPFSFEMSSQRQGNDRELNINSSFAKGRIAGTFKPSTFIEAMSTSIDAVAQVVTQRTKHFFKVDVAPDPIQKALEPVQAMIDVEIADASPINAFVPDVMISGSAILNGRFIVEADEINVRFDTIALKDFALKAEDVDLFAEPTMARVTIDIRELTSNPHVHTLDVGIVCDSIIRINDQRIIRPNVSLSDREGEIALVVSGGFNEMKFGIGASGKVDEKSFALQIDSASYTLDAQRGLRWKLTRPSGLRIEESVYTFDKVLVQRAWSESVEFSGSLSGESFNNFDVRVTNFPMRDVPLFIALEKDHPVRLMDGLVTDLKVSVNGPWSKPVIDLNMNAVDVAYNGAYIGALHAALRHEERSIAGKLNIMDKARDSTNSTLTLTVGALPIDLAFAAVEKRLVDGQPIDIELHANDLTLAAIEPFIPAIERLRGSANATITVKGTTPEDITLGGKGEFKNARFLASSTNIEYKAAGVMHLEDQTLFLDTITIRNMDRDLRGGVAQSNGQVFFQGLSVDSVDFVVTTPTKTGVKVMNRASQARSPNIYGDLVISSGTKPIHFFGKLETPKLHGDIVVNYSDITFPKERSATKARQTAFIYVKNDSTTVRKKSITDIGKPQNIRSIDTVHEDSSTSAIEEAVYTLIKASTPSFSDKIEYDLDIYLRGRTLLTMIFGVFEMLIADLEQVDRNTPLSFTGRFADNSTNLRGVVRLKEGASTYKFYKPFRTSGTLNFTTGGMTNPGLDLKAVYEDYRTVSKNGNTGREDYRVELSITGTKKLPRVAYRVWRNNREVIGDSTKVAGDALMLILLGRTQDELNDEGQGNLVNEVNAAFSAVATNALGDIIGSNGGIVQSTQLDVGSDISQSRLTVSGQIFGDVSYRVSGQISDFTGNNTFTLTLPFSVLSDADALRYLQMDFSHTVNNSGNITRQTRLWEIKLGARLP